MKLLEDKKDKLGWAFVMCLVETAGGGEVQVQPVLRMVEACDKLSDSNLETMTSSVLSSTHQSDLTQILLSELSLLAQGILPTDCAVCITHVWG